MTTLTKALASSTATLLAAGAAMAEDVGAAEARTVDQAELSSSLTQKKPDLIDRMPTLRDSARATNPASARSEVDPPTIQATDTAITCFKGYGCSYAEITCDWIPGAVPVTACVAEGEAIRYPSGASLWVDYILYGPGFTELDTGRRECRRSRPCDIEGAGAMPWIRGDFAMCVHTWIAGNNDQPMACARVVV